MNLHMSDDIDTAQKNQKRIGAAADTLRMAGPADNLSEEAGEV
jgi:hypothetical protein